MSLKGSCCLHPNVVVVAKPRRRCRARPSPPATPPHCPRRVVTKEKYTEKAAADAVRQIAAGMHHAHLLGIAHRDLKPENLMYTSQDPDSPIKIVDFGLGKVIGEANVMFTACGTPGYVAPEILRGESYTTKVDIWSLGVILYILLCGFPPFYSENNAVVSTAACQLAPPPLPHSRCSRCRCCLRCRERGALAGPAAATPVAPESRTQPPSHRARLRCAQLFDQIKRAAYDFPSPWWDGITESAKDLIRRMLVVDPTARYSAEDVMEHPWVKSEAAGAGDTSLAAAQASIRKLRLKERLRAGVRAIGAMAALRKLVSSGGGSSRAEMVFKGAAAATAAAEAADGGADETSATEAAEAAAASAALPEESSGAAEVAPGSAAAAAAAAASAP